MGALEISEVIGSIILISGEITYIVCDGNDPKTYNKKALVSKLTEYIKDGNFDSIQVLRFDNPFFEKLSKEELRKMYKIHVLGEMYEAYVLEKMHKSYKNSLEKTVST